MEELKMIQEILTTLSGDAVYGFICYLVAVHVLPTLVTGIVILVSVKFIANLIKLGCASSEDNKLFREWRDMLRVGNKGCELDKSEWCEVKRIITRFLMENKH